jgi:hypothetical protein
MKVNTAEKGTTEEYYSDGACQQYYPLGSDMYCGRGPYRVER